MNNFPPFQKFPSGAELRVLTPADSSKSRWEFSLKFPNGNVEEIYLSPESGLPTLLVELYRFLLGYLAIQTIQFDAIGDALTILFLDYEQLDKSNN